MSLPPPVPIARSAALMGDGKNVQGIGVGSIHDEVRVSMYNHLSSIARGRCPHRRVIAQQGQGAMNCVPEIRGTKPACFECIPACSLGKFHASGRIEYDLHFPCLAMIASTSLKTSSAGIHFVRPASISATRRAISSSQALAISSGDPLGSPSRLTISRWANSPRSLRDKRIARVSSSSRLVAMENLLHRFDPAAILAA